MTQLSLDEINYISEQIKKTISLIEHSHFQWIMRHENNPHPEEEEYPGWTEVWLKTRIRDLYFLILAYLEAKSMKHLLTTFKEKFNTIIDNDKEMLKAELTNPEGEPELVIITEYKQFLEPFKIFDYQQTREDETKKLTSILKNTDYIVKNCNVEIKNETDIYKQVKWVLGLYYPSCRKKNNASFIQEFKSYNPDILIPELKTAIEYKYVKNTSDKIDEFIDQIRVDAANYINDYHYENFVAVIYIQNTSIATPENIEVAWRAKKFPNNWELVIVNGSPTTSTNMSKK